MKKSLCKFHDIITTRFKTETDVFSGSEELRLHADETEVVLLRKTLM